MISHKGGGNDSSSDEDANEFRSNIQLPRVDLANYRKQHQRGSSKTNIAKAGKKLKRKSVRFPDLYGPRDTILSNSSTTNNSTESSSSSDEECDDPDSRLPSFKFNATDIKGEAGDAQEGSDGSSDGGSDDRLSGNIKFSDSNDDSDREDERRSRASKGSVKSLSSKPLKVRDDVNEKETNLDHDYDPQEGETDITDQWKRSRSMSSSSKSIEGEKHSGIKGIFRKFSLADHHGAHGFTNDFEEPSNSDTFLGRVLSFGSGGGGGGGLVPGASRRSRDKQGDEEKEIGGGGEDDGAVEMKRLDFSQLNNEAKKLIAVHVPEAANMDQSFTYDEQNQLAGSSRNSTAPLINSNNADEADDDHRHTDDEDQGKNGFYAPNLDYIIRGNDDPEDQHLLLDESGEDGYIAPPKRVHAGVLSSLLKLYQNPQDEKSSASLSSRAPSDGKTLAEEQEFGTDMPYHKHTSSLDFTKLKSGPQKLVNKFTHKSNKPQPGKEVEADDEDEDEEDPDQAYEKANLPSFQNARPKAPKKTIDPVNVSSKFHKKMKRKKVQQQKLRITVHISDILHRQRFIMMICKALMLYGAPTHRLEEYMTMTSRVLEIDGQFVYFPGCMIVSFGDAATRTSEVHMVRCQQGLNLSKLSDTHTIYKAVIHDLISVDEASQQLEALVRKKNQFSPWLCVFLYGLGSSMVCPFAFGGGWFDIPVTFGVGLCVGYLQFFVSSMSNLYSSVFEVTASIVVSFIARGIGSINDSKTFCFSAIAQGSLALILPGYIILCGSLELQSRNIVAGSVRMFYAIIYSLFLGFGITLGAALFGWVYKNSTSDKKCRKSHNVNDKYRILFVPMFSICLGLINQARWRQLPVMIVISCTGYVATYFAGKHFQDVPEFTAAIGAFIVGILGNMYSRVWKGMAVSAMLPAIFVQVPSGIASQSSLLSGIQSADQITHSNSSQDTTASTTNSSSSLSFGSTMVEVSIGISVGLFAAALVVYPFGKRRTGLFTL